MKINKTLIAMLAGASLGVSGQAMAVGTAADTDITNTVSISYTVGTETTAPVEYTSEFKVDNRVDMTLVPLSGDGQTTPMSTIVANKLIVSFKYALQNAGNSDQNFTISAINTGLGTTIGAFIDGNADATANVDLAPTPTYKVFEADAGGLITTTELSDNTIEVAASTEVGDIINDRVSFWVSVEIPTSGFADKDTAVLEIIATAASDAAGTPSNNGNTLDKNDSTTTLKALYNVFADGKDADDSASSEFNGKVSTYSGITFEVGALIDPDGPGPGDDGYTGPKLTTLIINDPLCDNNETTSTVLTPAPACNASSPTNYTPKAIPGALVEFTFTVTNSGSGSVLALTLAETLTSEFTDDSLVYVANSAKNAGIATATAPTVTGNTISVLFGDLATTKEAVVKYRAILK